jgi:hypothetical protein
MIRSMDIRNPTPATISAKSNVDLQAAIDRGITVAEVTYCNSISLSEHVVMNDPRARAELHSLPPNGR